MNYVFPPINATGKSLVRHFSVTNPWIDFVVAVDSSIETYTASVIEDAMNEYWDSDYEAYGDVVEQYLRDANITYEIAYHDPYDESDEYENAWETFLDALYAQSRGTVTQN